MTAKVAKSWFITGASRGFGRALAEQALARGDRVAALVRRPETMAPLVAQHGGRLWVRRLDVTDGDSVHCAMEEAFDTFHRIDVVVSSAGHGLCGAAEEVADHQIRRIIDTNLIGAIQVIRSAIPHLRAQGGGHVIQISGHAGQTATPGLSLYHATQWGIEGFVDAVAAETAEFGLTFSLVECGWARTDFADASMEHAAPLAAYSPGPVGELRRRWAALRARRPGDPAKVGAAILNLADQPAPPARLALGSDAYQLIREGLAARLAALEAQREFACAMDAPLPEIRP